MRPLTFTVNGLGGVQASSTSFVDTNESVEACITNDFETLKNQYLLVKSICLFILTRWIMVKDKYLLIGCSLSSKL